MPEYEFTLIIDGDLTDEDTVEALFDAGCDDATIGGTNNIGTADFAREARSLADAIVTAIAAVESVPGLRVRRLEPDDLVTIPDIAERLGRTSESVRLLANGERGGGGGGAPSQPRSRTSSRNTGCGGGATLQPGPASSTPNTSTTPA